MILRSLIIIFVFIFLNDPHKAQAQIADSCNQNILSDSRQLFDCLSNSKYFGMDFWKTLEGDSCEDFTHSIRSSIFNIKVADRQPFLSCETINETWRMHSGEDYYWGNCIPSESTIGTKNTIKSCLTGYFEKYRGKKANALASCQGLYDTYQEALRDATDVANFFGFKEQGLDPKNIPFTKYNGKSVEGAVLDGVLMFPAAGDRGNLEYKIHLENRSCDIAAEVIDDFGGSVDWEGCTGFDPNNIASHVQSCLGLNITNLQSCQEIRTQYEQRLRGANFGSLPENYSTLTCDQLQPIIASIETKKAEQAVRQAQAQTRATENRSANNRTRDSSSGVYWTIIILIAVAVAIYLATKSKRKNTDVPEPTPRKFRDQPLTDAEAREIIAAINNRFDSGTGKAEARMFAHVKDSFELRTENGSKWKEIDFHIDAFLSRNIGAMPKAEREMLRVVELLDAIDDANISNALNRPRLGLVYGDGKATVDGYSTGSVLKRYVAAKNLSSGLDYVRLGMNHLNLNADIAKSSLVEIIETLLNSSWKDNPFVAEAASRLRGGAAWSGEDALTGDFDPDAPNGLFLGLDEQSRKIVRFSGEGSVITIAAPGSGKTQTNVLPNLLEWDGPAIVLDVKGELYAATAAWRAKNVGPVYKFSPLDPDQSHCFNPLDLVRSDPDHIWEDSRFLAAMIIVPQSKSDPFWETRAQDFLTAAIAAVCVDPEKTEDRTLSRVIDYVHSRDLPDMLARLQLSGVRAMERAGASWESAINDNAKQVSSFLATAQTSLSAWESSKIERVIGRSDWHPFDLREAPYPTIYITLKPGEIDVYSSLLRVFVAQHIRTLVSKLPNRDVKPILFMLDEMPRLKYMPPIEEALEVGRQYGIKLWMFAQSLGQLEKAYPNASGMIGSCAVRIFMNPSMHDGTAERISKELGFFESPLDGSQQKIAEPQELAGPRYKSLQLVLPAGAKPFRVEKQYAYETEPYAARMHETLS